MISKKKKYPTPNKHPRSTVKKKYPTPNKHPWSQKKKKKNTPHLTNIRNLNLFSREKFTRKNGKKIRESFVKRLVHLSKGWSICQKGGPFVKRCGPFVKRCSRNPLSYTTTDRSSASSRPIFFREEGRSFRQETTVHGPQWGRPRWRGMSCSCVVVHLKLWASFFF